MWYVMEESASIENKVLCCFEYSWNPNYSVIALGTDLSECVTDELLSRDNDNQTFVCTSLCRQIIQRISKHTCQTFLTNLNVCECFYQYWWQQKLFISIFVQKWGLDIGYMVYTLKKISDPFKSSKMGHL